MTRVHLLVLLAATLIQFSMVATMAWWGTTSSRILSGNGDILCLAQWTAALVLFILPVCWIAGLVQFARRRLLGGLAFIALGFVGPVLLVVEVMTTWSIERAGYVAFTREMEPLVLAIEAYERREGEPPPSLDALVPADLSAVPKGRLAYFRRSDGVWNWLGPIEAEWELAVPCGCFVGFDQIFYWPTKAYPKSGRGGWIEPIGDWAYVHE